MNMSSISVHMKLVLFDIPKQKCEFVAFSQGVKASVVQGSVMTRMCVSFGFEWPFFSPNIKDME